jgi:Histidine phosphatase superfamily (branch 1)
VCSCLLDARDGRGLHCAIASGSAKRYLSASSLRQCRRRAGVVHADPVDGDGCTRVYQLQSLSHGSRPSVSCHSLSLSLRSPSLASFRDKHTLILVRHGESTWNLENKFTGWYDCPLSEKGHQEVVEAGQLLAKEGLFAQVAFTSLLKRAIRTLWHVLEQTDRMWIPVKQAWQLNGKLHTCTMHDLM